MKIIRLSDMQRTANKRKTTMKITNKRLLEVDELELRILLVLIGKTIAGKTNLGSVLLGMYREIKEELKVDYNDYTGSTSDGYVTFVDHKFWKVDK